MSHDRELTFVFLYIVITGDTLVVMVLMTSQYVCDIHTIAASLHFRHSMLLF